MSLSFVSNTVNALGIFGRMTQELENHFGNLSKQYSKYPENDDAIGIFNHLSLVIGRDVPVGEMPKYLDLLKELKPHLPFRLKTNGIIVIDEKHLALSFDTEQTQQIRDLALKYFPKFVVTTHYTKSVWYVPEERQGEVREQLRKIDEMIFGDFILVANRQDDANTVYSSNRYH